MCYNTKLTAPRERIENAFQARMVQPKLYTPREVFNGFTFAKNPVVLDADRGAIVMAQWGLVPFWAKDDTLKKMTLNARIETAAQKPAFRNAVKNRCLVIAEAFYEWQWLDPKGKAKQKYIIRPKDQELFGFAGFYSEWTQPEMGEALLSYTIATTEANALMAEIHNRKKRMPIIVKETDRNRWLSGAALDQFAFPYEVALMAEKVSDPN